jgi:hypothetical protein
MISRETAAAIWHAYREMDAGEKLLQDMARQRDQLAKRGDEARFAESLPDAFGRMRGMSLGIPSGDRAHQLFDVSPLLADSVIRAHIANKRAELIALNERAVVEANTPGA